MKRVATCLLTLLFLTWSAVAEEPSPPLSVMVNFFGALQPSKDARAFNVTAQQHMRDDTVSAIYGTTNKYNDGPAFGGVFEVEDTTGRGPLWGVEIDTMSIGPDHPENGGKGLRRGLGVVVGVNQGRQVPTVIGYGIALLPFYRDRDWVSVNFGLHIGVHSNVAAIAIPAGDRIALEESGMIAFRYNPATLNVELMNGQRVVGAWSVK